MSTHVLILILLHLLLLQNCMAQVGTTTSLLPTTTTALTTTSTTTTTTTPLTPTTTTPLNLFTTTTTPGSLFVVNVGMMISRNSSFAMDLDNSAGAAILAVNRIYNERLLPAGTIINFTVEYEQCMISSSAGVSYSLIFDKKVDMIIGPPCIDPATVTGNVANYYNIPVLLWGNTFASVFADNSVFPNVMSIVPNFADLSNVVCDMIVYFKWSLFSIIYQTVEGGSCLTFQKDFESISSMRNDCVVTYKGAITSWAQSDINYTIEQLKARSRIILLCFDDLAQLRKFSLKMFDSGMNTDEYVYILPDTDISIDGNGLYAGNETVPFWIDKSANPDGRDSDAKAIAKLGLQIHVDMSSSFASSYKNFSDDVLDKVRGPPLNCTNCNATQASRYAKFMYDAMMLYGYALGKTINQSGIAQYRNGTLIGLNSKVEFEGMSGKIVMGGTGIRNTIYAVSLIGDSFAVTTYVTFAVSDRAINVSSVYNDNGNSLWNTRNGVKPRDTPICGFDGRGCPLPVFEQYKTIIIIGIVVIILIVVAIFGGIGYVINLRIRETQRQNKLWQVPLNSLIQIKMKHKHTGEQSMHSIRSGPSTSTKLTIESVKGKNVNMYTYQQETVVGYKYRERPVLVNDDMNEFRMMRQIDHDNLNRFIGMVIDGPEILSIWRFCARGSLKDVINNNTLNMDSFFVFSLIRDVCEGLWYIHNSFLGCHGYLKSTDCLIDDRWQIKISNYGLKKFKTDTKKATDLLWTSPELLREKNSLGTKPGDIYSFAIVCSEVVNMKNAWEPSEVHGNGPEEIVYLVRKGGPRPLRPTMQPAVADINPALLHLIRDCWSESISERPKIDTVRSLLKSMVAGRSANLMDHVFSMLEQYAVSLEEEVAERTKELVEEKKKSDVLLYRMLPKQIADRLKLGQSIEPETFDSVTVFFSDVVSFTVLASKCTPLQVVNLLNDLYTILDGIISDYDVYKVETIGDGYLCVSGLPHRNGSEHARHIANMALSFMRSLDRFRIPHLPNERVQLRIGIHTGGCVSGVVGLAMPRYCLFGDTVNTASRMESNGKPNKIHISAETNHFLTRVIGGYVTESRGDGKGVMETFWLISSSDDMRGRNQNHSNYTPPRENTSFPKQASNGTPPVGLYEGFKMELVNNSR